MNLIDPLSIVCYARLHGKPGKFIKAFLNSLSIRTCDALVTFDEEHSCYMADMDEQGRVWWACDDSDYYQLVGDSDPDLNIVHLKQGRLGL